MTTAKNILEHLSNIAYGPHMAKLEAFEKYFKEDTCITKCSKCLVPASVSGFLRRCDECSVLFCGKPYCPSDGVKGHQCVRGHIQGHTNRAYCSKECAKKFSCNILKCTADLCRWCRRICVLCSETYCSDHVRTFHGRSVCADCVRTLASKRRRARMRLKRAKINK